MFSELKDLTYTAPEETTPPTVTSSSDVSRTPLLDQIIEFQMTGIEVGIPQHDTTLTSTADASPRYPEGWNELSAAVETTGATEKKAAKVVAPPIERMLEDRRFSNERRYRDFHDLVEAHEHLLENENPAAILFRLSRIAAAVNAWGFRGSILPKFELPVLDAINSLVERGSKNPEQFTVPDLIKFVWGTAHLGRRGSEIFESAADILTPAVPHLSGSLISNIAEAYAYAKRTAPVLFDAIATKMVESAAEWREHDIARVAMSAHTLRVDNPRIMEIAEREFVQPGRFTKHRDAVPFIWTAVACDLPCASRHLERALEQMRQTEIVTHRIPDAPLLAPLYQACVATRTDIPWWLAKAVEDLTPFRSDKSNIHYGKLNDFETSVLNTLRRIEKHTPLAVHSHRTVAGFSVDFQLAVSTESGAKRLVCLECDGVPFHYLNSRVSDGLSGIDIFRNKIIRDQGYRLVRVNSDEWYDTYQGRHLPFLAEKLGVKLPEQRRRYSAPHVSKTQA